MKITAFLGGIRHSGKAIPPGRQAIDTVAILLLGVALGVFSKFLDTTASNRLPSLLNDLDVRNFLGRFAIWVLIALCIAIYSNSSIRAAVNVFTFFAGMVASYYLYTYFAAGFFPRSYAAIWAGFTVASPFLASLCWYAKGESWPSLALSSAMLAVLFNMSFVYGAGYFGMRSILELVTFLCGVAALRRSTGKGTLAMVALGIGIAALLNLAVPFDFG